ncbi:hypothetical protein [Macrococcus carouselicus]|uniref:Uncharacterized protein n=1 Tax=Macrococcus carouselicus TaxID=69969 RepID=A0A9Q8CMF0_9STAP|nr:hypothetical protein [Macrococcus carouselicus]TDM02456.1 hypothetical protein ERX40_07835 [Macrococcus carouselicus]
MQSQLNEVTCTLLQLHDLFFLSDDFHKKFIHLLWMMWLFQRANLRNILSIILFVTNHEQLLNEWMHQEKFKFMLERNGYIETEEIGANCVIIFYDDQFQPGC